MLSQKTLVVCVFVIIVITTVIIITIKGLKGFGIASHPLISNHHLHIILIIINLTLRALSALICIGGAKITPVVRGGCDIQPWLRAINPGQKKSAHHQHHHHPRQ